MTRSVPMKPCTTCGGNADASGFCRACRRLVAETWLAMRGPRESVADWQTHYDLGIAYQQRGLPEDAFVELMTAVQRSAGMGGDAWIRLSESAQHPALSSSFRRAVDAVRRARLHPS